MAIDLPPLKCSSGEKALPNIALTATTITVAPGRAKNEYARTTKGVPFAMSRIRAKLPALRPPTRKTLTAPDYHLRNP